MLLPAVHVPLQALVYAAYSPETEELNDYEKSLAVAAQSAACVGAFSFLLLVSAASLPPPAALDVGHRNGSNLLRERPCSCPLWVNSGHAMHSTVTHDRLGGKTIRNTEPYGTADDADSRPPCAWMIVRQIAKPIPMPLLFVLKKGSK